MASAVVRVKRRITDEPFDRFVLNCKRAKTTNDPAHDENAEASSNQTDATRTILKFATTVSTDEDITVHLTKLRKTDAEELARKVRKPASAISKLRQQLKDDAKSQRFKVINCFRSMENEAHESDQVTNNITVVDVIKEDATESNEASTQSDATDEAKKMDVGTDKADKFVYDLYLVDSGEQPTEIDINDYISIRPFDDLVYQTMDETLNDSDDVDSEDSNDEADWRNDYPDDEDGLSIGEDDMREAVEDLRLDNGNILSSDDDADYNYGDEPVVHFLEADEDDEYTYFKKHGRIRSHAPFYRTKRSQNRAALSDSDDSSNEENDTDSSRSSKSTLSPLMSCDENDDN